MDLPSLDKLSIEEIDKILECYSLEQIIQLNDLTEAEVLLILVEEDVLKLPSILPVDIHDTPSH